MPERFAYLLFWYDELRGRAIRGMGIEPIQYTEIIAYRDIFSLDMDEFDVEMLCRLDIEWQLAQPKPKTS